MVKIMENPIKMDDLGVPLFLETPRSMYCMLQEYSLVSSAGHPPIRPSTAGCLELFLGIPLVWNLGLKLDKNTTWDGRFFFLSWVKHMISICTAKNVLRFSRHQCVILNRSSLIIITFIYYLCHT